MYPGVASRCDRPPRKRRDRAERRALPTGAEQLATSQHLARVSCGATRDRLRTREPCATPDGGRTAHPRQCQQRRVSRCKEGSERTDGHRDGPAASRDGARRPTRTGQLAHADMRGRAAATWRCGLTPPPLPPARYGKRALRAYDLERSGRKRSRAGRAGRPVCPCRVARGPPPQPDKAGATATPLLSALVRFGPPGCADADTPMPPALPRTRGPAAVRCRPLHFFSCLSFVNDATPRGVGRLTVWGCLVRLELAGGRPGHRLAAPLVSLSRHAGATEGDPLLRP